ncbi:MAG: DUF433 domain-containing protein [Ktedonobacterales bacterium]
MPGIYSDPDVHGEQPVVESDILIYLIPDMLAQGFPPKEMRDDYDIQDEHVRLAFQFAAETFVRLGT